MTNLTKHISDGPYTVHKGVVVDRNKSAVRKDACAEVLNFPAKVLEVLRERYKQALEDYRICAERESCGEMEATLDIAESLSFSREDVTR